MHGSAVKQLRASRYHPPREGIRGNWTSDGDVHPNYHPLQWPDRAKIEACVIIGNFVDQSNQPPAADQIYSGSTIDPRFSHCSDIHITFKAEFINEGSRSYLAGNSFIKILQQPVRLGYTDIKFFIVVDLNMNLKNDSRVSTLISVILDITFQQLELLYQRKCHPTKDPFF